MPLFKVQLPRCCCHGRFLFLLLLLLRFHAVAVHAGVTVLQCCCKRSTLGGTHRAPSESGHCSFCCPLVIENTPWRPGGGRLQGTHQRRDRRRTGAMGGPTNGKPLPCLSVCDGLPDWPVPVQWPLADDFRGPVYLAGRNSWKKRCVLHLCARVW